MSRTRTLPTVFTVALAGAAAVAVGPLRPTRAAAAVEDDLRDGDKHFEEADWAKAAAAYDRAIGKAPSARSAPQFEYMRASVKRETPSLRASEMR